MSKQGAKPRKASRGGERRGRSNRSSSPFRGPGRDGRQLEKEEFLKLLQGKLQEKYQDKHPLMLMLYSGKLTPKQLRAWIINRFYLQKNIPLKDAAILSNCPETEVRRLWIGRILKREGLGGSIGTVSSFRACSWRSPVSYGRELAPPIGALTPRPVRACCRSPRTRRAFSRAPDWRES